MRKFFFFVACSLLMTWPSVIFADGGNTVEIILVEMGGSGMIGGDLPLDNPGEMGYGQTDPNQFRATITGRTLAVMVENSNQVNARVVNGMGNLVMNRQFVGSLSEQINTTGAHVLQLQCGNLTLVGHFIVQ